MALQLLLATGAFAAAPFLPQSPAALDSPAVSATSQRVEGQVVRPGARQMLSVPHIRVTLHRVGSDHSGPLDSTRADGDGRFAFSYQRTGDSAAVYFVSATYGGIAYFTSPLMEPVVKGEKAEIAVYDTTSGPLVIGIRGHHVVVSAVDANAQRSITEVYELANDSSVTRIAASTEAKSAVWSGRLPAGATGFQVSQGDIPAAAVAFANGHVLVFAPIAPGLAQLAFTYSLPASAFPLSIPIESPTQIFEVLVEDEKGQFSGARLKEREPVILEKRSFRRFLADDVPMNAVAVVDLPPAAPSTVDRRYLVALTLVIGGAMILALAWALNRR